MLIPFKECIKQNGQNFKGVIHIGAHLGEECLDYKNSGIKNVVWVEANVNLIDSLKEITEINCPSEDKIMNQYYYNCLLSSKDVENVEFYVTNNGQSSSMLKLGSHQKYYPHISVTEIQNLQTLRFDTLAKQENLNLDLYDFINLDVQGSELDVLIGFGDLLRSKTLRAIYTEINFEELYIGAPHVEKLAMFLEQYGFKKVLEQKVPQQWGDALFLKNERS